MSASEFNEGLLKINVSGQWTGEADTKYTLPVGVIVMLQPNVWFVFDWASKGVQREYR